jgi:hypothetical protein
VDDARRARPVGPQGRDEHPLHHGQPAALAVRLHGSGQAARGLPHDHEARRRRRALHALLHRLERLHPARAAQATGLYTHQIGIFATTGTAELNPGFPTFGTMLRQQGYETYWIGK